MLLHRDTVEQQDGHHGWQVQKAGTEGGNRCSVARLLHSRSKGQHQQNGSYKSPELTRTLKKTAATVAKTPVATEAPHAKVGPVRPVKKAAGPSGSRYRQFLSITPPANVPCLSTRICSLSPAELAACLSAAQRRPARATCGSLPWRSRLYTATPAPGSGAAADKPLSAVQQPSHTRQQPHLPEIQDAWQHGCSCIEVVSGGQPAQQGWQRAHHGAHPRVPGAQLLQRGVHARIQHDRGPSSCRCWHAGLQQQDARVSHTACDQSSSVYCVLTCAASKPTPPKPSTAARPAACRRVSLPVGRGRRQVRFIWESCHTSRTWFSVLAEAAAIMVPADVQHSLGQSISGPLPVHHTHSAQLGLAGAVV